MKKSSFFCVKFKSEIVRFLIESIVPPGHIEKRHWNSHKSYRGFTVYNLKNYIKKLY